MCRRTRRTRRSLGARIVIMKTQHLVPRVKMLLRSRQTVEAFVETDKAYLADEANSKKDDGCTAVAAVLLEDRLIVANVGDSRAVLSRSGKGALRGLEKKVKKKRNKYNIKKRKEKKAAVRFRACHRREPPTWAAFVPRSPAAAIVGRRATAQRCRAARNHSKRHASVRCFRLRSSRE